MVVQSTVVCLRESGSEYMVPVKYSATVDAPKFGVYLFPYDLRQIVFNFKLARASFVAASFRMVSFPRAGCMPL